jgi:hypothetical protein
MGMKDIRTYDGNTPGNWISFTENRHTQDGVIGTESPINGSYLFQNGQNEFYASGVQQLPFPEQTTPSPTPRYPFYIGLDTQYAFVRADALTITANGKTFNTLNGGSTLKVTSNPGSGNNLTWEATWFENGSKWLYTLTGFLIAHIKPTALSYYPSVRMENRLAIDLL